LILIVMKGIEFKLFTAGPVSCFPEVLDVMNSQMFSHRSKEYQEIHMNTVELLKWFLETDQTVLLFPSSGSGVMEASIRNAVSKGGKVLVTVIGAFGERYAKVVEANGRKAIKLDFEWGKPVDIEKVKEILDNEPDIEAVTVTHNETSTGVLNPLKDLAKAIKKYDKLLFVDAVSSMGAADIKFDEWGIDIVFSSSQKAFGVPPGLAIGVISNRVLEISKDMPEKGWYFDLYNYYKVQLEKKSTPSTPPIPQIMGLNVVLKKIREMGKYNWLKMYKERAERVREGVREIGLKIFAEPGFESPTITTVLSPEDVNGTVIYEEMRKRGFELAKGYGKLKNKTFRIGHMGYIKNEDIEDMLLNLREVVKSLSPR